MTDATLLDFVSYENISAIGGDHDVAGGFLIGTDRIAEHPETLRAFRTDGVLAAQKELVLFDKNIPMEGKVWHGIARVDVDHRFAVADESFAADGQVAHASRLEPAHGIGIRAETQSLINNLTHMLKKPRRKPKRMGERLPSIFAGFLVGGLLFAISLGGGEARGNEINLPFFGRSGIP